MGLPAADEVALANAALDDLVGAGTLYLQLHLGAPGAAGDQSPAATTERAEIVFGDPAADGRIVNTGGTGWADTETETATDYTLWDDPDAGTLKWIGHFPAGIPLGSAVAINAGDIVIGFDV